MTSPALFVLFLAHVCSTFDSAWPHPADHDVQAHTPTNAQMWTNTIHNVQLDIEIGKNMRHFDDSMVPKRRGKRAEDDSRCEYFQFTNNTDETPILIYHPHAQGNKTYYSKINCTTLITAPKNKIIELTFINEFHIEAHDECIYDYLEIRDGREGYAKSLGKVCGTTFPNKITTSGPYAWLKFHADETIEYEGFTIKINFKDGPGSSVPYSCYHELKGKSGVLSRKSINENCEAESTDLDILWTIITPVNTKIYLNFTVFGLASPNDCGRNLVEVFGESAQADHRLALFCGSIANPVSTGTSKDSTESGNIMKVRLYVDQALKESTKFNATFTAFRTLDPSKDERCNNDEFDCEDYTCIDKAVSETCMDTAHCRLKTDLNNCKIVAVSTITDSPHIMIILIIFSLILSVMSFVFLFKCIRKLYQDHKIIKEHIRQSCEDRLDSLVASRLTLDAKRLQRDSEPRASLERENQANEMFKRKRDSFTKRKPTSIDSDYIQETSLDIEEEWRHDINNVHVDPEDIRIERNGRRKSEKRRERERSEREKSERDRVERERSESKKEELLRKKESAERERERERERTETRQIRDASVGAPDTKESSCQTRESLFQADPPASSDGSGTNSRGFSTFGYSGATLARPSPAPLAPVSNTSEITIELLRQVPRQDTIKPQKKIDRRPISNETTRSAPDVIIVSKPIR